MSRRYAEHEKGSSKCKYTRSFPPLKIAACWEFAGELSDALKIEIAIKSCRKQEKLSLIHSSDELSRLLNKKGIDLDVIDKLNPFTLPDKFQHND